MNEVWAVGIGGFLGTVMRYGIAAMVGRFKGAGTFPLATLVINVSGCLVLGALVSLGESGGLRSETARAFFVVGVLGGFTTFSAFGHETFQLLCAGRWAAAVLSAALQLALGVGGVWAGHVIARRLA